MAREDEEVYGLGPTCVEDDADDDITDDRVMVETNTELLVMAARFIGYTGCNQIGSCDPVAREEVLDSASMLELSVVDVEADAEACEEEAVVGPEQLN